MSTTPTELSPLKRALVAIESLQARLAAAERQLHAPIAIVGLGCRMPAGGDNPGKLWNALAQGADGIVDVPEDRWDVERYFDANPDAPGKLYVRRGGFIDRVDQFDPQFFGISPREAVMLDPQQRLMLEVCWEALEDAGYAPDRLLNTRTGVFAAICSGDYARISHDLQHIDAYTASGVAHSMASGRISYVLGLQGPSVSIDTACSSSLVAVHMACVSLRARECRMALAGGVHLMLAPDNTITFCKSRMMSADSRCKTFDDGADGFVLGEGCGVVVLKRLEDAEADGDAILAVIRGSAVNQDGPSSGLTVPSGPAQEAVIRDALAMAGVAPADVDYVEAHGTGTSLGDPIEVQALASVYGAGRAPDRPLLLGSIKTNIGHLEAASGVAGLIKLVLSLQHEAIPPQLHLETPNRHVAWERMPIEIVTAARAWKRGARRRLAGVSSFGFSGTNAHVLVEEPPADRTPALSRPVDVVTVSGRSAVALAALAQGYADAIGDDRTPIGDFAFTANAGRARFTHRIAVVGSTRQALADGLRAAAAGAASQGIYRGQISAVDTTPVAWMFTGQGAQYAGMGRGLFELQPVFREAMDRADAALRPHLQASLIDVIYGAPTAASIDQTAYTQPALFAIEYTLAEVWRSWGIQPAAVMGHSIGEYVAACVAGVMSVEDALTLVATRGRLMQALPAGGAMAAVLTTEAAVRATIAPLPVLSIAAVNGPDNVVIAGPAAAIDEALRLFDQQGARSQRLVVSHAFHSALMDPMLDEFERVAAAMTFAAPVVPLVSNVTGALAEAAPTPRYWRDHARGTVRFAAGVEALVGLGPRTLLEVGPTPTLTSMARRVVTGPGITWLHSLRKGRGDWEQMLDSAAALYVKGVPVEWTAVNRGFGRRRVALPTYPFERERFWFPARQRAQAQAEDERSSYPLLGSELRSPALKGRTFERRMSSAIPAWVEDHAVFGSVIMPATGLLEMARAAAVEVFGTKEVAVSNFVILAPLVLSDDEERRVQTIVSATDAGASFEVVSAAESGEWTTHAQGDVATSPRSAPTTDVGSRQREANAAPPQPAAEFYERLAARGLDFGPRFKTVVSVAALENGAFGEVALSPDLARAAVGDGVHPVLLDGCLQVLAAALEDEGGEPATYLPIGCDRFAAFGGGATRLWSRAQVRPAATPGIVTADIDVVDEAGTMFAQFSGIALRRASRSSLQRERGTDLYGSLYEVEWEQAPGDAAPVLAAPSALAAPVRKQLDDLCLEHKLNDYDRLLPEIDKWVAALIGQAFTSLGLRWDAGASFKAAEAATMLNIAPQYRRLFERFLEILAEDGVVSRSGLQWTVRRAPVAVTGSEQDDLLSRFPAFEAEIVLTARCGDELAGALSGTRDPLQLLFPGGDTSTAEQLYRSSPFSRVYNASIGDAVGRAVAERSPHGRLRVLEIGGGTGGTTTYVVPKLSAANTEYLFTDVSPLFVARAAERFGNYPFFKTRALDIERDPAEQGLDGQRFDLIVAANVLHATADLARTFGHVSSLLAPGGLLVMLEVTRPQRWVDLTFGLTPGWWKFEGDPLRERYPLLRRDAWLSFLGARGYSDVVSIPADEPSPSLSEQAIIIARGPERAGRSQHWLLCADESAVADAMRAAIGRRGHTCTMLRRRPSDTFGNQEATVDPQAGVKATVARLLRGSKPIDGIAHLWSLDACAPQAAGSAMAGLEPAVGSLLEVVQAVAEHAGSSPRVCVVTRGAQAAGAVAPSVEQAPVLGLARVIAMEHRELACSRIDLDPAIGDVELDAAARELVEPTGDDEIAFRNGARFVPRFSRLVRQAAAAAPWALVSAPGGGFDGLDRQPLARCEPGDGQIEVEVRATGLNFKDVLSVMGMYPGDPGPLGGECAGIVTRVGAGVKGLVAGDAVMGAAPGCFRSHVVMDASLTARKPSGLTFEDASAFTIPFITAAFALEHLGKMKAGDRVLIHAAAGGVGLAAVQLALLAGAEVFATAGSDEKRAYLASLGVRHVFDSRSVVFADAIKTRTAGAGVNLVLNSLSGLAIERSLEVLASGGSFLEIGKRGILDPADVAGRRPDAKYFVIDWGQTARESPAIVAGIFAGLVSRLEAGMLRPLPVRAFELADVASAFRFMAKAQHTGKLAVSHGIPLSAPVAIRPDATYLIVGGLSGLGLLSAEWLANRGARHLLLIGRSEPAAAARDQLTALEARGVRVYIGLADAGDRSALERAVMGAIGAPAIAGVIQSAGVLDDGVLTQQSWPRFEKVLHPKVDGSWNLAQVTGSAALDFFLLYSSAASAFGSPGQGNHAAANAYLDAMAHHRRHRGQAACAINWGGWADIGSVVRQNVGARIASQGMEVFTPEEGLRILDLVLAGAPPQLAAVRVDWPVLLEKPVFRNVHRFDRFRGRDREDARESRQPKAAPAADIKSRLDAAPEDTRLELLSTFVREEAQRVLGLAPGRSIDPRQPLHDFGLDSLMAVEFRNALGGVFGRTLPATLLFDYPTVDALTAYLAADLGLTARAAAAPPAPPEKLLDRIEELSDEEVDRLLSARTKAMS